MRRCKTCVETDTRPTSKLDENGICLPCKSVSAKARVKIDWDKRAKQLQEIIAWSKANSQGDYDCIIGVSGGKDSTRQALMAREWGLNPLLVAVSYPPEQVTERGQKNLSNLVKLGFDTINIAPAPIVSKDLMRNCLRTYGNIYNATDLVILASLPRIAVAYKIPTVLLGENPSLSFGNNVGGSEDYDGNKNKHMHTLQGGDPKKFATPEMTDKDLYWYRYPSDEYMEKGNIRIVYQGYFVPDFNDHTNFKISSANGLVTREGEDADPENIGGIRSYVALDDDFVIVNQMIKYIKHGFGKATQEVGVAVRDGLMSREEGLRLVRKYDGKCNEKYIKLLINYLQITRDEFDKILDRLRNKNIFYKDENGTWQLREEGDE